MRTERSFARYVAWQVPGWLVAALVLFLLCEALGLAPWLAGVVLALYVGKDLALYPAMRVVFRTPSPAIPIGERAVAVDRLAPSGYVRVNGELWRARAPSGDLPSGTGVIVRAAEGFTLIVERVAPES